MICTFRCCLLRIRKAEKNTVILSQLRSPHFVKEYYSQERNHQRWKQCLTFQCSRISQPGGTEVQSIEPECKELDVELKRK